MLVRLICAGLNVARLIFLHGSPENTRQSFSASVTQRAKPADASRHG